MDGVRGFPDLPPIWAALVAVVAILASRLLPIFSFGGMRGLASLLVIGGFLLIVWSAYFFWKKRTTIEPHHTPKALIVEGPYRVSRNPIYLGMFLGILGVAFWAGTVIALLIALTFPFIIQVRFIRQEEAALREAFAEEAEAYFASTGRWVVWL